ncbi:hypothetical protein RSP799_17395 [Ralstonia solanacearum]|nr:hypothetical protein RSP799_17395 [Ralstonia solanacearum]
MGSGIVNAWRAFMGAAISAAVAAAHAATPSRITEVTLYPDSATVVRTATVAPGARSVELTCLPPTFDPQSLRVEGDADVRVGDIRTEAVPGEGSDCAKTALDARIRAVEDQYASVSAQIKANALSAGYLKAVSERSGGDGRAPGTDFSTLGRSTDALARSAQEVYARGEQLKQREQALKAQLTALYQAHGTDTRKTVHTLSIAVAAPRGGELRVSYQTARAGWRPAYQASLDSVRRNIVIDRQATVAQATGEDWRGVRLRLSTGQPRSLPRGPEPSAWTLDIMPPPLAQRHTPTLAAPAVPTVRYGLHDSNATPLFPISLTQGTFAAEFEVPGTVDLPSDAQKITYLLNSQTLPATFIARSTPRLDSTAYLVAVVDRPEGIWPAGAMQLRRDGAVVGATQWNPSEEDRLTLPFGQDELVSVTTEPAKTLQRSAGLLDSRKAQQIAAAYTVRNRHREPIAVEILEATPVSESDDIKVQSAFVPEPTQHAWQRKPGVIAWEQTLQPNESARFTADYVITYPKDAAIRGLR